MTGRRFILALAGIALFALAVRLGYAFAVAAPPKGDADWYHRAANWLADGRGFRSPTGGWPTAFHPPGFPAVLSVGSLLGLRSPGAHQAIGCALGAAATVPIGLLGRRLVGPATGLLAAGLAAVFPPLIAADAIGMSESLFVLLVPLALLVAVRVRDSGSLAAAAVLGLLVGAAALTRTEALMLVPLLAVPLAWNMAGRRLAIVAALCAGAALLVVPWSARNSLLWDTPVGPSTTDGSVLAGANCPSTYSGALLGRWDFGCLDRGVPSGLIPDEPRASARWRRVGLEFAADNPGRVPVVLAARELRTWGLYEPAGEARLAALELGTPLWLEWITLASALVVLALAVAGAVVLRRGGGPVAILLAPVAMVALATLVTYGQARFRAGADPVLVLLAAVALSTWASRLRGRDGAPAPAHA